MLAFPISTVMYRLIWRVKAPPTRNDLIALNQPPLHTRYAISAKRAPSVKRLCIVSKIRRLFPEIFPTSGGSALTSLWLPLFARDA
jgi:hypothetical protein